MGQEEAIKKAKGPCVILAGAGTGKTYTIVEKIKYLIDNKIYKPEKIVCITFSNEAANNLLSRVRKSNEFEEGKEPIIKTFHAFSAELLRKYGYLIGIDKEFKVLIPDEAKVILHRYLKINAGNCHNYIKAIGTAKDLGISIESLREYIDIKISNFGGIDLEKRLDSLQFELKTLYLRGNNRHEKNKLSLDAKKISDLLKLKKFVAAWGAYEKLKKIKGYQDYSDLNKNALYLLKNNSNISGEYDYVIVDEFQDTNKVQLDLLYALTHHKNVTVVGDLNQSIYRFRGAYKKNFDEFKEFFNIKNEDIFNLDMSYRSSNKILRVAHKLILNNYEKYNECFEVLNVNNREGENIEVYELKNSREEARKIVELAQKEISNGREMKDICIMFRTHQQGKIIKQALEANGIPYVSVNKISLLKEKSIKTVIDYLIILYKLEKKEKGGEQAWWDLLYQLNFIDDDLIKVGKFIKDNKDAENISALLLNSLEDLDLSDGGRMIAKILVERIKILIPSLNKNVLGIIKDVYTVSGLFNLQKNKEEKVAILNLHRFYELAKEHAAFHAPDFGSFIYYLDILKSLGIEIEAADSENDGVRLMTSHATKGLEYKTVIISNLAQKRFPIERYENNSLIPAELSPEFNFDSEEDNNIAYFVSENERRNQLFEERRLCYVAFTRAKEKLILTYAQEYGKKNFYPSIFLQEISYKTNKDIGFNIDEEEKYIEPRIEQKSEAEFSSILMNGNFDEDIVNVVKNGARGRIEKDIKEIIFSPSSLLSFTDCQKKYEYKYVYNMPEPKTVHWEAIMLGSFVHRVLEDGVIKCFRNLKEFIDLAKEMHADSDWEGVELNEALHLIKVFFERNKSRYNENSRTEQLLKAEFGGVKFIGFADRIDFNEEGLAIIDYKTGKSTVAPRARSWQLGYYALAASQLGKVKRITLDMLQHEQPIEFVVDDRGNAKAVNSSRLAAFNIYDVESELIQTAHAVFDAYEKGFKSCSMEKNCEFCNEYVWGL